jgi:hypothetical protein
MTITKRVVRGDWIENHIALWQRKAAARLCKTCIDGKPSRDSGKVRGIESMAASLPIVVKPQWPFFGGCALCSGYHSYASEKNLPNHSLEGLMGLWK